MYRKLVRVATVLVVAVSLCATRGVASPTHFLPGDSGIGPAAGEQTAPAIAQGGNLALVVWSDNRANVTGGYEGETAHDIYGVRMDSAGQPLESVPIAVFAGPASQGNPKVSWNGSNWLVVFETYLLSGTGGYYDKGLQAIRVAPSGQVLDTKPINLFGLRPPGGPYWTVASDGNNWVVVNEGNDTGGDFVAVRVSPAGLALDPPTRVLVKETYYMRSNLKLAFAGGVFLLTFNDVYDNGVNDTKAVRFDANLNLLDATPLALMPSPLSGLASNGNEFYIVWTRQNPDFSVNVAGTRVSITGQKLDGNGVNLSGTKTPYTAGTVVWDGTYWRVTWGEYAMGWVARVNSAGTLLDPGSVAVPGLQIGPTAADSTGGAHVVSTSYMNFDTDVIAARIAANNTGTASKVLSTGAPAQLRPDIATNGSGYMAVYRSAVSGGARVMAQPLDAGGNPLTPGPVQLDSGAGNGAPGSPNVAWNGSVYMATWGNVSGIVAQRLMADGTKIDAVPFVVMTSAFGPADVAAHGDQFLVTARRFGYTPEIIYCVGARVQGASGAVLDVTPVFVGGYYISRAPAVVSLGSGYFVAMHNNFSHDDSGANTIGAFVPDAGTTITSTGFEVFSTAGGNGSFEIGLASSGNTALLVQSAERTSGVETDLIAYTVQANGTASSSFNLTPWVGNQYKPRVAWDGQFFVLIFQDQKFRPDDLNLDQLDARGDLMAMRVTQSGGVIDPHGFIFSASPASETDPTVVAENGKTLLAAAFMLNDGTHANYRVGYQILDAISNEWPIAVASASPEGGDVPVTVNLDSEGSNDPDGFVAETVWDFGDGAGSSLPNPPHTYTEPGPYLARLTVMDNGGASASQGVLVKAVAPNIPPVAVASASPSSGPAPLDVTFRADGSHDPDGFLGNCEWTYGDGNYSYGATSYHTYQEQGHYTATLKVFDSRGETTTATVAVNVGPPNAKPIAVASATPATGSAPLNVNFSSAGSTDPDGTIVARTWDFGDGTGSSAANPNHTYNTPGTYTATLTVHDNSGNTASANMMITVSPAPGTVLRSTVVTLSASGRGSRLRFTGRVTVRNGANVAVSGVNVTALWQKPGGATTTQTVRTGRTGVATLSASGGPGTYTLSVSNLSKSGYSFDSANSVLDATITK
ncbi:MAG: PKD domain-containing protein [Candidatus Sumerlaeaceae bacterium]|nr:PKD domain-containing protein [Candidatus Sumerlaeaceae bacterium]